MVSDSVAASLAPASKSAPLYLEGQPASKFHRATSLPMESRATMDPLRRAESMSPSMTCLRHSHSALLPSRRRSRVMSAHFIAPSNLRISSLPPFVASLYSMTSLSDSTPVHLRKLSRMTLSNSRLNEAVLLRSGMVALLSLGGGRAALPLADLEDDELGRLHRANPDLDDELPLVHAVRRVVLLVAPHVEGLVRGRAHQRPTAPHT